LQGLVNLLPNGPDDGGLIVAKGGHLLSEEFHKEFAEETRIWQWTNEWYGFTEAGVEWLKGKGLEWVKVEAGPGDLIVWDSRTPHYNCSPTGERARMAVYTCYMPVSSATQEELQFKKQAFESEFEVFSSGLRAFADLLARNRRQGNHPLASSIAALRSAVYARRQA
jgi:hypothetical protein